MKDVLVLQSTHSTNQDAFKLAKEGATHGFSVIAATQTGGRGRLGKAWQSIPGQGLYCSIIIRPNLEPSDYPKITLVAGLAVAQALEHLTQLSFQLKWPNDVYCRGKKCCGILAESSSLSNSQSDHFAVVGVGININTDMDEFNPELRDTATSLFIESERKYQVEDVFKKVRKSVLSLLNEFERTGFEGLLSQWKKKDLLKGEWLEWVTHSGEIIYGESLGPDDSGQLLVRDALGVTHEVISGDVSLATRQS